MALDIKRIQRPLELTNAIKVIYPNQSTVVGVKASESTGGASLPSVECLYGVGARQANFGTALDAKNAATTAFNSGTGIITKNATLQTGGLFMFSFSSVTGYYHPFIAIPVSTSGTIRIYSKDNESESSFWETVRLVRNSIPYNVYYRNEPLSEGVTDEWIVKSFS